MLLSLLLAAADPAALAPTGKWTVEYADTMCVLSRDYGTGADKVTLALRPVPMSTESEVVLITRGQAHTTGKGTAAITLLPAGHPVSGLYGRFPLPKGDGHVATAFFRGEALEGVEKATAIDIRLDSEDHALAIPGIASAMAALSTCQDDLLKSWGIDPAERKLEATQVAGNPARFFGVDAYPVDAIRDHAQGRVVAIATIDPKGYVAGCVVAVTSGNKSLDEATCRIMRTKVRFTPARDKDGHAVASHYLLPVRWALPN